jgi:hypothetical protein
MAKKTAAGVAKGLGLKVPEYKPTLTLDEKVYPDLKSLKVDDVVDVHLKVKITSVSKSQYDPSGKLHVTGTIENAAKESSADVAEED